MALFQTIVSGLFGRAERAPTQALPTQALPMRADAAPQDAVAALWRPEPGLRAVPPARARWYTLRTGRGSTLMAGAPRLLMSDTPEHGVAMLAMVPEDNPGLCFLLARDLRLVEVQADGLVGLAISAFRLPGEDGTIRLRHPLSPVRFMAVTMPGQGAPDGCVIFDGQGRGKLDYFTPEPVAEEALSLDMRAVGAELCAACARPFRAQRVLALLRGLAVRPDLAEPILRVLPRDELALLARWVLERPADGDLLAEVLPGNDWVQRVAPPLAEFAARRAPAGRAGVLASPATDEFAAAPFEGHGQPQLGQALVGLMRAEVRPLRGACLIATARNEGPYLLEWLAHHRALGFEHAFIYTNDNSDGSETLLHALAACGAITLIHNTPGAQCGPQYKAYPHAFGLLPQVLDYRWAAVLDLDEYIGLNAGLFGGIGDYLAWHESQPADAIALSWLVFAAGRGERFRAGATPARFLRREAGVNQHVKTLCKPRLFWSAHAHYPLATLNAPFVYRSEDGGLHHHAGATDRLPAFAPAPSANFGWVAHYWLRTAPETLWKVARGHPDWKDRAAQRHREMSERLFQAFVALSGKADLVEDQRMLACAPRAAAELEGLRLMPGVAEAEARMLEDFSGRLDRMVRAFVGAPAQTRAAEPASFAAFREILRPLV